MEEQLETTVCYRHPDRPTRLRCSECDRPICVECSHDAAVGQRCPECSRPEGRHRVVTARQTFGAPSLAANPVTFTIIAVAVGLFVLGFLSPDLNDELIQRFASINVLIDRGEWWRVLTAAFLHGSVLHVGFNMYALYLFGPRLEREVGGTAFASLYLAAAAGGGAASTLLGPDLVSTRFGLVPTVALGASGAIFGLFGAWMFVAYKLRWTPAGRAMFNQLAVLLLINLALPLIVRNIDWRAHLGGLATGILVAWLWSVLAAGKPQARRIRTIVGIVVLAAALTAVIVL